MVAAMAFEEHALRHEPLEGRSGHLIRDGLLHGDREDVLEEEQSEEREDARTDPRGRS